MADASRVRGPDAERPRGGQIDSGEPLSEGLRALDQGHGPRPLFIGGCPRSGTTLLGAMLGVGPGNLTVPEASFKWKLLAEAGVQGSPVTIASVLECLRRDATFAHWNIEPSLRAMLPTRTLAYGDVLRWLATAYGRQARKPSPELWIDHTPRNMRFALSLSRLAPEAKFIHLVRDGRAVAASILPLDWGPNDIVEAAWYWARQIAPGLAAAARLGPERLLSVRYEDVVLEPAQRLKEICGWVEIPYDEAMVYSRDYSVLPYTAAQHSLVAQPPDPSRTTSWQDKLSARQIESFEYLTGDLLSCLGYEPQYGIRARRPRTLDHAKDLAVSVLMRQLNKGRKLLRRVGLSDNRRRQ